LYLAEFFFVVMVVTAFSIIFSTDSTPLAASFSLYDSMRQYGLFIFEKMPFLRGFEQSVAIFFMLCGAYPCFCAMVYYFKRFNK
jgi:hypothetical protein